MSQDGGRAWSWRHAILDSDLPSTTRHVLLTLSCFMNDLGEGAYPSQERLAEKSGLTDRAVRKHLDLAESQGWLERTEHGFRGQKWRTTEYRALWPDILHVEKGEERGSARFTERSGTSFQKVRNDVPTILPENITPLPQKTDATVPTQDVGGKVHVSQAEKPDLYVTCCRLSGHRPGITDRRFGWEFDRAIIAQAQAALAADGAP